LECRIYYHKINSKADEDVLVYSNKENRQPELFNFFVDRKSGRLYVEDFSLIEGRRKFVLSYTNCDSIGHFTFKPFFVSNPNINFLDNVIGTLGNEILVKTSLGASTFQVLAISPEQGLNQGRVIIPAYKDVLKDVIFSESRFYCLYFSQGKYTLNVADSLGNSIQIFDFPLGINVEGLKSGQWENVINLRLSSIYQPPITYLLNKETLESNWVGITIVNYAFKEYKIDYVEYLSKDSTLVPMYICHKGTIEKDGSNPTILAGYGGFGISSKPEFDPTIVAWMEMGGVYVLPIIRGGGDLGLDWYRQTMKEGKQIVIDDFIKAADYLIDSNIACSEKLALEGASHGGWLVNMVANQRPDLCKAIISRVGPSDLIRTQMDTSRFFVIKEFGEIKSAEDVKRLITFSPLFNIKKNISYPSMLFETARYDFNVSPFHVFKMVEHLKEKSTNDNPILLMYTRMGNHNGPFYNEDYHLNGIKSLLFLDKELGLIKE
jgi:prolyl oligopeptidase